LDPSTLDRLSRSFAAPGTRRRLLSRLGIGGAAAATVAASHLAAPATALAADVVCKVDFLGNVRLGPTFDGPDADPVVPGALSGRLTFTIGSGGSIITASLELDSGEYLEGVGQLDGRHLAFRLVDEDDHLVFLDGIAETPVRECSGVVDGLMRGPVYGDLGDWHGVFGAADSNDDASAACGSACPAPGSCIDGVCHCADGYGSCLPGYVWREAFAGDYVCVEPWSRDQAASDNASMSDRIDPNCAYGADACLSGYVWREAFPGDHVCVDISQRTQAANDNAAAAGRVDPGGAYGANTCVAGYVWREATSGDVVCVTPAVRTQVANDNAAAASRVDPNCVYGADACLSGYVWRDAAPGDTVCVEVWVRDQTAAENAAAGDTVDPLCLT
jgi:hypothetical protein